MNLPMNSLFGGAIFAELCAGVFQDCAFFSDTPERAFAKAYSDPRNQEIVRAERAENRPSARGKTPIRSGRGRVLCNETLG